MRPEKAPIRPEKARFSRKDFCPIFSENLGLKPPFVSPRLDFPNRGFRVFSVVFRGLLRDPLRGRFPSQRLSILLPLIVLPFELSPTAENSAETKGSAEFWKIFGSPQRRRDDNKNKICDFEGVGVGSREGNCPKTLFFVGNATTIKFSKCKFYCRDILLSLRRLLSPDPSFENRLFSFPYPKNLLRVFLGTNLKGSK